MPWFRYFVFIGGALLAFLFISDAYAPKEALVNEQASDAERSILRIRSDQKWPERIVLDTSLPTISPPQELASTVVVAPRAVADIYTKTASFEAFAQVQSIEPKTIQPKKPVAQVKKRRVAKVQHQRAVASMQQSGFGFFGWE